MMNRHSVLCIIALLTVFNITYRAQSDYETVKAFKDSLSIIEEAVKNAGSLEECDSILISIGRLEEAFGNKKDLLDESLYPENFTSSIENLKSLLQIRKADFTQINQLKDEISNLNRRNTSLISEIKFLQNKSRKDDETIASLQKLTKELKKSLRERDNLIRTVIDSLLSEYVKQPLTLNEAEKKEFIEKVETGNLIFNVQRTIRDNIQFLKVTRLSPEDLSTIKKEKEEFLALWNKIGPDIVDLYGDKKDMVTEITVIDQLFEEWESDIDGKIWELIKYDFEAEDIVLKNFTSGSEFLNVTADYIDDEISSAELRKAEDVAARFHAFVDSVWLPKTKTIWMPILIGNKMFTPSQKDSIDHKISEWKSKIEKPGLHIGFYVLIFIVILLLISYLVRKFRGNKNSASAD